MAKEKKQRNNPFAEVRTSIDDMRTGLNDFGKSIDRITLAKFCRIIGVAMLVASLLYLITTLKKLGVI